MPCPFLEYRDGDDDHDFDHLRPYCAAQESFVSPMRADICKDRHDFDHRTDCDVFRAAVERGEVDADADAPLPLAEDAEDDAGDREERSPAVTDGSG